MITTMTTMTEDKIDNANQVSKSKGCGAIPKPKPDLQGWRMDYSGTLRPLPGPGQLQRRVSSVPGQPVTHWIARWDVRFA